MMELSELVVCLAGIVKIFGAWGSRKKLLGWGLISSQAGTMVSCYIFKYVL